MPNIVTFIPLATSMPTLPPAGYAVSTMAS